MVTLKVLHLASFSGNMGDNANHRGIRKIFNKYLNFNMTYDELEIREFYISWGKRFFDSSFADLVNDNDLLIIGGGNFFDLYLDKSVTGTTINMTEQILQKIKTPIVFFGVGFDPYKGITDELINRFKRFLDNLIESEKVFISLRNDGSVENIKKYIGEEYVKYICKVPDGGFFTEVSNLQHPELQYNVKPIAINVAGDMPNIRFKPELGDEYLSYEGFIQAFANVLCEILEEDEQVFCVFVPHIYLDLKIISDILQHMKDEYRRKRLTVAPYLHGEKAHDYVFGIYKKAVFTIGMRFHANVCPIGFNTPTIPLSTQHFKIRDLYYELGLEDRIIDVSKKGFEMRFLQMFFETLRERDKISRIYKSVNNNLSEDMALFCSDLDNWLKSKVNKA